MVLAKRDFPIVGDVIQRPHTGSEMQFQHYDFGLMLSKAEKRFITEAVHERARALGMKVGKGLVSLSFVVTKA